MKRRKTAQKLTKEGTRRAVAYRQRMIWLLRRPTIVADFNCSHEHRKHLFQAMQKDGLFSMSSKWSDADVTTLVNQTRTILNVMFR
jgi:hypothetical protein